VRGLAEKTNGILEDQTIDRFSVMAAFAHFEACFWDGQRIAVAPIACSIHPKVASGMVFKNVNGPAGGAFGFGIERNSAPKSGVEHHSDSVFFHMVNKNAARVDAPVVF